jgi:MHS family shikimate/dehydroshikimate transporter-like MFS transporter
MTDEQFVAWGWRLPFLFSIILVVVGLWIRFTLAESSEFQKVKDTKQEVRMPIIDAIRMYPKNILLAMGARFAENGFFYIYATFVLAYATQALGMNRQDILNGVLIAAFIETFTIPAFGAISDKLGRRPVYIFGAVFSALMSFPLFTLLGTKTPQLGWIAIVLGLAVGHAAMYGPQASFLSELFGTTAGCRSAIISPRSSPARCHRSLPPDSWRPTARRLGRSRSTWSFWPSSLWCRSTTRRRRAKACQPERW